MSRLKILVISPYSGEEDIKQANIAYARQCCRMLIKEGYSPLAPHLLYPQFLNDDIPEERSLGMVLGRNLVPKFDEAIVFTDRGMSEGMQADIAWCSRKGVPISFKKLSLIDQDPETESDGWYASLPQTLLLPSREDNS